MVLGAFVYLAQRCGACHLFKNVSCERFSSVDTIVLVRRKKIAISQSYHVPTMLVPRMSVLRSDPEVVLSDTKQSLRFGISERISRARRG